MVKRLPLNLALFMLTLEFSYSDLYITAFVNLEKL